MVQPDTDTINYDEAANYIGATTTVCGKIKDVSAVKMPNLVLLMGGALGKGVGIEIVDGTITGDLSELYKGQIICVSGLITDQLLGGPMIVVDDPSQIVVQEPEPEPAAAAEVSWEEGINYIGEEVTLCGPIIDAFPIDENTTLLGMGASCFDASAVGIEVSAALLGDLPEDLYVGQEICVTGTPHTNPNGGASIAVSDLSQISMPGEAAAGAEEAAGMSWEEAADYIGEEITVCGPIIDTMDIGGPVLLGMGVSAADYATVGIEIVQTLLAEMPEDMFVGKTICVTGVPYTNPYGGANIQVTDLSQIVVQE